MITGTTVSNMDRAFDPQLVRKLLEQFPKVATNMDPAHLYVFYMYPCNESALILAMDWK